MKNQNKSSFSPERRNFLKAGAIGGVAAGAAATGAGIILPDMLGKRNRLKAQSRALPNKKRMIIFNMLGGCDTINMVIPCTLNRYYERRPNIAIDNTESLALDTGPAATTQYRLHPQLTYFQSLYQAGDLAAINQVGYPTANLSHFTSEDVWSYGVRGSFGSLGLSQSGWIARYLDAYLGSARVGAVSVGMAKRPDFSGGTVAPLNLLSLSTFKVLKPSYARYNHPHRLDKVNEILQLGETNGSWPGNKGLVSTASESAFSLSDDMQQAWEDFTADSAMNSYTNSYPERFLRDIAMIIYGGFDTEIFYTYTGGFDTHANQQPENTSGGQMRLFNWINTMFTKFIEDLKTMGVWNDTVIVFISEFGRRTFENGSLGTDHGHGQCMLVMGGNVNGGIYGQDLDEADLNLGWLGYETDFRKVYQMIIERHMGRNLDPTIFPEALVKNASPGDFI